MQAEDNNQTNTKWVAIIGGGPAGLMAADVLAQAGHSVIIYDQMTSLARKFLMAGRGGLNLTHSEELELFLTRYGQAASHLRPMIEAFSPQALRDWCETMGEPTFIGSSGRVFPRSFKASPLLRLWLRKLAAHNVEVRLRHRFISISHSGEVTFATPQGDVTVHPSAVILAMGGASWARLGSDGAWAQALHEKGVALAPFKPANCGFDVDWSHVLREKFAGTPLKAISLSFGQIQVQGEMMITHYGVEGGAIYALSAPLREAILAEGRADLNLDLRPGLSLADLIRRLKEGRKGESRANHLRKAAGLSPLAISLLREKGPLPQDNEALAQLIKSYSLQLTGVQSLQRAISTAGGVAFSEMDENLMISSLPGVFCCGEMLDWEAPTGGYLLQASFASANWAAEGAKKWLQNLK